MIFGSSLFSFDQAQAQTETLYTERGILRVDETKEGLVQW